RSPTAARTSWTSATRGPRRCCPPATATGRSAGCCTRLPPRSHRPRGSGCRARRRGERMDILQLIKDRRSIPRFKPDPVPRDVIEMMLEAATWAPNHTLTEPWEFYVLEGAAREGFAAVRRNLRRTLFPDPAAPADQDAAERR